MIGRRFWGHNALGILSVAINDTAGMMTREDAIALATHVGLLIGYACRTEQWPRLDVELGNAKYALKERDLAQWFDREILNGLLTRESDA